MEFEKKLDRAITSAFKIKADEFSDAVSNQDIYRKTIITDTRSGKMILAQITPEGSVLPMKWKEWKLSSLPDTSSELAKKEFIQKLFDKETQFNRKVELNSLVKAAPDFVSKVDALLNSGRINYTKRGV